MPHWINYTNMQGHMHAHGEFIERENAIYIYIYIYIYRERERERDRDRERVEK